MQKKLQFSAKQVQKIVRSKLARNRVDQIRKDSLETNTRGSFMGNMFGWGSSNDKPKSREGDSNRKGGSILGSFFRGGKKEGKKPQESTQGSSSIVSESAHAHAHASYSGNPAQTKTHKKEKTSESETVTKLNSATGTTKGKGKTATTSTVVEKRKQSEVSRETASYDEGESGDQFDSASSLTRQTEEELPVSAFSTPSVTNRKSSSETETDNTAVGQVIVTAANMKDQKTSGAKKLDSRKRSPSKSLDSTPIAKASQSQKAKKPAKGSANSSFSDSSAGTGGNIATDETGNERVGSSTTQKQGNSSNDSKPDRPPSGSRLDRPPSGSSVKSAGIGTSIKSGNKGSRAPSPGSDPGTEKASARPPSGGGGGSGDVGTTSNRPPSGSQRPSSKEALATSNRPPSGSQRPSSKEARPPTADSEEGEPEYCERVEVIQIIGPTNF